MKASLSMSKKIAEKNEIQREYEEIMNGQNYKILLSNSNPLSLEKPMTQFKYIYSQKDQYKLGKGSYGVVYKCYIEIQEIVYRSAVKIIKIEAERNKLIFAIENAVETTRKQIQVLMQLKRQTKENIHIIKIKDIIKKDNYIYMILEYCNDKDLDSYFNYLREENPEELHSIEKVNLYFAQLLYGIQSLVENHYVHRDIKPANVLVNNGTLKIADFGLINKIDKRTDFMIQPVGTKCTAAPQIWFKQKYTSKCDIFSMGALYYWMLYKKYPFDEKLSKDEYLKYQVQFPEKSYDNFIVPYPIIQLIKRMLKYEQKYRPEWEQLFQHQFFNQHLMNSQSISEIRMTWGRKIEQMSFQELNKLIPFQIVKYFPEKLSSRLSYQQREQYKQFIILGQIFRRFNIKIAFFKRILQELSAYESNENSYNQIQQKTICDLIKLGVQKYILYLNKKLERELTDQTVPQILDAFLLYKCHEQEKLNKYSQDKLQDIKSYQNSQQKPKLSKQAISLLLKKCEYYEIAEKFPTILYVSYESFNLSNEKKLEAELSKAIIELIFLLKRDIKDSYTRYINITSREEKRFRNMVILVHHLNMFVMHKQVFPNKSSFSHEQLDIEPAHFLQEQKFAKKEDFNYLCEQIVNLLERFEQ